MVSLTRMYDSHMRVRMHTHFHPFSLKTKLTAVGTPTTKRLYTNELAETPIKFLERARTNMRCPTERDTPSLASKIRVDSVPNR
jgi:hypothetical protein